jgi:hypothetical protein
MDQLSSVILSGISCWYNTYGFALDPQKPAIEYECKRYLMVSDRSNFCNVPEGGGGGEDNPRFSRASFFKLTHKLWFEFGGV